MADEIVYVAIAVVYSLIFIKLLFNSINGFDPGRAKEIYGNKELFNPRRGSYSKAKKEMEWLDPVVYYDSVKLANQNKLTLENIQTL